MSLPGGVVTFLFTDVVGSSAKWDSARSAMETAIRRHDEIFEEEIESRGGVIIKKMGDGLMAVFPDPTDAVRVAVESQRRLRTEPWEDAVHDFAVRMGIDTGSIRPVNGDYVGPIPNRAARIEAAGHGGQIVAVDGDLGAGLRHAGWGVGRVPRPGGALPPWPCAGRASVSSRCERARDRVPRPFGRSPSPIDRPSRCFRSTRSAIRVDRPSPTGSWRI